jgi:hypothetical protein
MVYLAIDAKEPSGSATRYSNASALPLLLTLTSESQRWDRRFRLSAS